MDQEDIIIQEYEISTLRKNTETLTVANKEVGLEANTEKTRYVLLSRHHNARKNNNIKLANRYFENVAKFEYFGTPVTNKNVINLFHI
jgi:hypothetical protein